VAKEIAVMSGGEYAPFTNEKAFQNQIAQLSKHVRNRYLLTFQPTDRTPGLHTLRVRLKEDNGARVIARTGYWAVNENGDSTSKQ